MGAVNKTEFERVIVDTWAHRAERPFFWPQGSTLGGRFLDGGTGARLNGSEDVGLFGRAVAENCGSTVFLAVRCRAHLDFGIQLAILHCKRHEKSPSGNPGGL